MNVISLLLKEHSKRQTMKVAQYVGSSPLRFKSLIECMLGPDEKLAQRAAWAFGYVVKSNPKLVLPYYSRCLNKLSTPCHNSIRRNILDSFNSAEIPSRHESTLVQICFERLNDSKEYIAVKALSISLLGRISVKYPEIMTELASSVRLQWENASPGFRSRARKVVKFL